MEVQLTSDLQAKLDQLTVETGRTQGDVLLDALAGYFEELSTVRGTLDSRYDDLKSGRMPAISGEAAKAHLQRRSAARRS